MVWKRSKSSTFVDVCVAAQGSTFLDSCDFERENICGMIQGEGDQADWTRVSSAAGGPNTDYSNMGKCTGEYTRRVHVTWHTAWNVSKNPLGLFTYLSGIESIKRAEKSLQYHFYVIF